MQAQILKSSYASFQYGAVRSDGKLLVTDSEVSFEPFGKALNLGPYKLHRQSIAKVEQCAGMAGGIMPITSDAICITLANDDSYEFILANPKEWIAYLGF
jgi:hypothetical protein